MPAINMLCDRAILIENGSIANEGTAHDVVSAYLNTASGTSATREWHDVRTAPGGEIARLRAVHVRTEDGQGAQVVDVVRPFRIDMEYEILKPGYVLSPFFDFYNDEDVHCFATADVNPAWRRRARPVGRYVSTVWIPQNLFNEGTVFVSVGLATMEPFSTQFNESGVVSFQIFDRVTGESARGDWTGKWGGALRPLLNWTTDHVPFDSTEK